MIVLEEDDETLLDTEELGWSCTERNAGSGPVTCLLTWFIRMLESIHEEEDDDDEQEEEDDGTTHSEDSFETVNETQLEPLPEENDPSFRQEDAKCVRKTKYLVRPERQARLVVVPPTGDDGRRD